MRRLLVLLLCLSVAGALLAAPAVAGKKKKKVSDSFSATALPFPNLSSATGTADRGCFAGQEGVHKVSHPFEVPFTGTLTATLEGFTGDWDLALYQDGKVVLGSLEDQTAGAAPEETVTLPLKKGEQVEIVVCNYAGEPQVEATYEHVSK